MQQDKTQNPLHECTAHIEGEKAINENYPQKAQTLGKLKGVKKRKKKKEKLMESMRTMFANTEHQ